MKRLPPVLAAIGLVAVTLTAGATWLPVPHVVQPDAGCGQGIEVPELDDDVEIVAEKPDGCLLVVQLNGADAYDDAVDALDDAGWQVSAWGDVAQARVVEDGVERSAIVRTAEDVDAELVLSPGLQVLGDTEADMPVGTPRVVGDEIVMPTLGGVDGFDLSTGSHQWAASPCGSPTWAAPVAGDPTPVQVIRCVDTDELAGIRTHGGDIAWRHKVTFETDHVRTGSRAVVLMGSGRVEALDLDTGDVLWTDDEALDSNVASDDDSLYWSNDAGVGAVDLETGDDLWVEDTPGSGLAVVDGVLILRTNDHRVQRLDPATGDLLWDTEPQADWLDYSDVIGMTDDVAVLMSLEGERTIGVYALDDGERVWSYDPVEDEFLAVTVADGVVAVTDVYAARTTVYDDLSGDPLAILPFTALGAGFGEGRAISTHTDEDGSPRLAVLDLG